MSFLLIRHYSEEKEKERKEEEKKKKKEEEKKKKIQVWKLILVSLELMFGTFLFVSMEPMYGFVG